MRKASSLRRKAIAAERRRGGIAIAICIFSTALAVDAIVNGWHFKLTILALAGVWNFTAKWLDGNLRLLFNTPRQVYRFYAEPKQEKSRPFPLAATISLGAKILFVTALVSLVI